MLFFHRRLAVMNLFFIQKRTCQTLLPQGTSSVIFTFLHCVLWGKNTGFGGGRRGKEIPGLHRLLKHNSVVVVLGEKIVFFEVGGGGGDISGPSPSPFYKPCLRKYQVHNQLNLITSDGVFSINSLTVGNS